MKADLRPEVAGEFRKLYKLRQQYIILGRVRRNQERIMNSYYSGLISMAITLAVAILTWTITVMIIYADYIANGGLI